MPSFQSVIQSWRNADPYRIHPTREHESEMAYWESGKPQAQFVADILPDGGTVLDFGCGDGRVAIPLAQLGFVVLACDAAPEMIERLNHQMKVQDVTNIVPFVADGMDRKILPTVIDAVNARAVFIHHKHADVERLVKNLADCLKSGGFLICDWPLGGHHERIDWIDVTTWDYDHRERVANDAHLKLISEGVPGERPSVWVKW